MASCISGFLIKLASSQAGAITSTEDLTLHKTSEYEVYVIVNDERRSDGPKTLTVKLTDINDVPDISNLGTTSKTVLIDETVADKGTTPVGTEVYDIEFIDTNTGDTHTFTTTFSPTECSTMYTVDTQTGKVSTLKALNFEDLKTRGFVSCDLIVTVDDGLESSTSKKLRITVEDVNEQQNGFQETQYLIEACEGENGVVIQDPGFIVDDVDINDVQTYTMDCGNRQTYFSMNPTTGIITQTREYDLDANNQQFNTAKCTVTATDLGGHTVTTKLDIMVNEANDNPPVLDKTKYYKNIPQNAGPGAIVTQCQTTDADVKTVHKDHTFSVSDNNFAVTDSCQIRTATDFSAYPVGTTFEFILTATDVGDYTCSTNLGQFTDTAPVTVVIIDPTTTSAVTTIATNNNNNNGNLGSSSGDSGSPAAFLENPTDLAWFIPAMIALAVMLGLLAYMIYRCCRVPGFCARLFNDMCSCCNNRDCFGKSKRGSSRITDAKQANRDNAVKDKAEPRNKANKVEKPSKPIKVREPAKIDGKYEWNSWATSDFSNAKVELR